MAKSALRDKDKKVLYLVVEGYVRGGHPVSSGSIAQTRKFDGSPATIRNIMVKLEEQGYLSQPHTSAGRVPTDKGLKYYVNSLLSEKTFARDDFPLIQDEFTAKTADLDSLLIQASRLLADYSDNLGFVISPQVSRVQFEHLRFIRISPQRTMAILVTPFQMVLTETLETPLSLSQAELDRASQFINQNFRGKTLIFVRDALLQDLPKYRMRYEDIINKLPELVRAVINREEDENRIFIQGSSRLLGKAELSDMGKLRSLFENFEEKAGLVRLLADFISLDRVKVLIGAEVNFPNVQDCSLVLSHYGTSHQVLGSLGIIGPKRIPYAKIIPLVDRVAKRLSQAITIYGREVSL
ncbi:MAG: heat-inducible transcriptional repressor HrcA [Candidatus Aminicenantales bacterium]|jgi:heat-inducible transcriptional repressor